MILSDIALDFGSDSEPVRGEHGDCSAQPIHCSKLTETGGMVSTILTAHNVLFRVFQTPELLLGERVGVGIIRIAPFHNSQLSQNMQRKHAGQRVFLTLSSMSAINAISSDKYRICSRSCVARLRPRNHLGSVMPTQETAADSSYFSKRKRQGA